MISCFRPFSLFASLLLLVLGSCSRGHLTYVEREASLRVRVVSDYVAGAEAGRVAIEIFEGTALDPARHVTDRERGLVLADDLGAGVEVAYVTPFLPGTYTVQASLYADDGLLLERAAVTARVDPPATITIILASSCANVMCPETGGTECVNGACATPACSRETPENCPEDVNFCEEDSDCQGPSICSNPRCIRGICLQIPRPDGCWVSEYCARELGCLPLDPPEVPGPNEPPCGTFCLLEERPCWYGYNLCDGETMTCEPLTSRPVGAPCGEGLVCDAAGECVPQGDGGMTDGGTTDGDVIDGDVIDGGTTDGDVIDGEVIDGGTSTEDMTTCVPTTETCNGIDDDCDGEADEGFSRETYYRDFDGDGYGAGAPRLSCVPLEGYVLIPGDCDDSRAGINPAAPEVCDNVDNDCDLAVDEGLRQLRYLDADGDGYGSTAIGDFCPADDAPGVVAPGDCDDTRPLIHPAATEICDGVDNDCNDEIDEGFTRVIRYRDLDGDGYGSGGQVFVCQSAPGYAANFGDCNDDEPLVNPGMAELCDNVDNNCNDQTDEGYTLVNRYEDNDGDGFGSAFIGVFCDIGGPGVTNNADCDDTEETTRPGATELCDNVDNNCSGTIDETFVNVTAYINSPADYAAYKNCRYLAGLTASETSVVEELVFPNLLAVGGNHITITSTAATLVSMPKLERLDGYFDVTSSSLTTVSLPVLETAGRIRVTASALTSFAVPALEIVPSVFELHNTKLTTIAPASLISVGAIIGGWIQLTGNSLLRDLAFPSLVEVSPNAQNISVVEGSPLLETFSAPNVVKWNQFVWLRGTLSAPLNNLHTVELPVLKNVYDLQLMNLPALANLDVFALETVSRYLILDTLPVTELPFSALRTVASVIDISRTQVDELVFPALLSIGAYAQFHANLSLERFSLPNTTFIGNTFQNVELLLDSPALEVVSAPKLVDLMQNLSLMGTLTSPFDALHTINIPLVERVYFLRLANLPALASLNAFKLKTVAGSLWYENVPVSTLPYNDLETVGSVLGVVRTLVPSLTFPKLLSVGGYVMFHGNTSLRSISLPLTVEIGTSHQNVDAINGSPSLESLSAPNLVRWRQGLNLVGTLAVPMPNLHTVDLTKLETVYSLYLENLPALTNLAVFKVKTSVVHLGLADLPIYDAAFPDLESVGNILNVSGTNIDELVLPKLQSVGGYVLFHRNSNLERLSFPVLVEIGTSLINVDSISGSPNLTELSAPNLIHWRQVLSILGTTAAPIADLTTVNLAKLETVYLLSLGKLPALTSLNLSKLKTVVTYLQLDALPATTLSFPDLTTIGYGLTVTNHSALTSLSLPAFRSGAPYSTPYVTIQDNAALTSVNLSALQTIYSFTAVNNPNLTSITVPASPSPAVTTTTSLSGMPGLCTPPVFTCGTSCSSYDPC